MIRQTLVFGLPDINSWKPRLLAWANTHEIALLLDSNQARNAGWDLLLAAGAADVLELPAGKAFSTLREFADAKKDWLFGFLSYDLKNEVERLQSTHPDGVGLPDLGFFQPETVIGIRKGHLEIHSLHEDPARVWDHILQTPVHPSHARPGAVLQPRIAQADYLATVDAIRQHIIEGDVYELNFCQEFFVENTTLDPVTTFERLNAIGQAPCAAFLRWRDRYLLCGSPERFLSKQGDRLLSQPIKGTRRRGSSSVEDAQIKSELAASEKDRAENVMIVDLVRNDLARHCIPGSVRVDELFGIYSFATVHQMISTVSGTLRPEIHAVDALRDAFPMGSMTGAPKVMAMELIEQYEKTRRGLYSGAVGYFSPEMDFDFNVVIRSILYNQTRQYVSVQVGGAIVYDSIPEAEYEECLIKASAMLRALA